ncbi:hypothetical protein [Raineyella sp. W15-4]|uniref:hypothetical protein n=1 Tax=Raineyella sp. W15-4 TaxID=3081651 RepID=UPI00295371DD|nr:hypothetical protein [Raineyella sp. W15-4]WOQ18766.1 hypothetical protein R0145_08905 [Raineyella sp. W15-4]
MSTELIQRTPGTAPTATPSFEGPAPMTVIIGIVALLLGIAMTLVGPAVLLVLGLGVVVTVVGLAASWAAVMLVR